MSSLEYSSRISGFYKLSMEERRKRIDNLGILSEQELWAITGEAGLSPDQADHMIENVLGIYSLPIGLALNFQVNGRDVLVPMAVEEPSIVAGASYMARLVREGGGFIAETDEPVMIGQMQILDVEDPYLAKEDLIKNKESLLAKALEVDPVLVRFGGGPRGIEVRVIEDSPIGSFLVLHILFDVRDAMGANAINTACEKLTPDVENITGGRVHLRILTNLADRRLARAKCRIPLEALAFDNFTAEEVRDGIIEAWAFAASDPYRAATHNKGIMNGVDAVVISTGNDWRAVEAGAHAFAARNGVYTSLSQWRKGDNGDLLGELEMPLAVGTIGGATRVHPAAQAAVKLMRVKTAQELSQVIVSVGLAQNLAALRALATEGIQRGHMGLHARQVAIAAGAQGDQIEYIARKMVEQKEIRVDIAEQILREADK
ncbi:MAG: hydroxymethylglutaryl-CoA reductase, degradative [Anaerolineales bacterium]|nr:hydroxymethylglutaryl-CoA reductase, degradative [Anaerolineales bacterium]